MVARRPGPRAWLALAGALAAVAAPLAAVAAPARLADAVRVADRDSLRRLDVGRVGMFVTNLGSFAWDIAKSEPGLLWPNGSDLGTVFASGLWLGGKVAGQTRVAVAEFSFEYGPGAIVGGAAEATRPGHRVYKVAPWRGSELDTAHVTRPVPAGPELEPDPIVHHSWSEYVAGAAPYGAPVRAWRLPDTGTPQPGDSVDVIGPDVLGDQMLWAVYNDADPALHVSRIGSTPPLGVEVQQTTFGFAHPEGLASTAVCRFRLIDKGANTIDSMFVSFWADPDLGGGGDDFVGCDTVRSLGFCYNARASDAVYGTPPPAVGYALLRGPVDAISGDTLGMTAFTKYVGGDDPSSAVETWRLMHGLHRDGSPQVDPGTGLAAPRFAPGDPVRGTGWLDSIPTDRRLIVSTGPFRMAPGDTQDVWLAITVGRGPDHLGSVGAVRCQTDLARLAFDSGFSHSAATGAAPCSTQAGYVTTNCPRSSEFWRSECALGGVLLTSGQLDTIAAYVDSASTYFSPAPGGGRAWLTAVMDPPALDPRRSAEREFAAMLANEGFGRLRFRTLAAEEIWLNPLTNVACPVTAASTIAELSQSASLTPRFVDAAYLDNVATHPRALAGVPVGLPAFGGGAGPAAAFPGSALDPAASPDSFSTVEIRFDRASPQSAYRYLRLERQSDGTAPPQGRAWLYGGFRRVPFSAWDLATGTQLEAAFTERAITDDSGTLLAPPFQPATFDSTWGPDASASGGDEYLIVFRRPVSRVAPRPSFAVDGFLTGGAPALYTLAASLRSAGAVIDNGDAFRFTWGLARSPGADSLLIGLAARPPDDPAVANAYTSLAGCLEAINEGAGLGAVCRGTIPSAISVQSVEIDPGFVVVTWFSFTMPLAASVERRFEGGPWQAAAQLVAGPDGLIIYRDDDVTPGGHYEYRLGVSTGAGLEYFGAASADVPGQSRFAFLGARPNPASSDLVISFSLATRDPARLELLDVSGRRVLARDLVGLGPGAHLLALDAAGLRSGIYLARITQGGRRTSGKIAIVH